MTDIFKGATDQSLFIELVDSSTGLPKTGIVFGDVTGSYVRTRSARAAITMATLASASAAHSDGGFILVDDTNQPGVYRLDIPDAAVATGAPEVVITLKATGCRTVSRLINLVNINNQVAYVPNAAADAAGGLPISDAGGLDLDAKLANTNEVTAARMGALTDWINGGRLDLLIDTLLARVPEIIALTPGGAVTVGTNNDKTGYSLTATTGLGNQTANITGNLSGSVGSVTGGINTGSGTITNLDALDTAQDSQHATTQSAIGGLNNLSAAQVNSEVDTALADIHLDHLLAVDYDPASKPGVATALLNELIENDGGVSRYTANALEQAPSGGGGGASASAIADAVCDELLSGHTVPGSLAAAITTIQSKANLITASIVQSSATVDTDGQLSGPIVIGDDYTADVSRQLTWRIAEPDLILAETTAWFGVKLNGVQVCLIEGTITEVTVSSVDYWDIEVDLPASETADFGEQTYDFSVELQQATPERYVSVSIGTFQAVRDAVPPP